MKNIIFTLLIFAISTYVVAGTLIYGGENLNNRDNMVYRSINSQDSFTSTKPLRESNDIEYQQLQFSKTSSGMEWVIRDHKRNKIIKSGLLKNITNIESYTYKSISKDNTKLVFEQFLNGYKDSVGKDISEICYVDLQTNQLKKITSPKQHNRFPSISPDARFIVYYSSQTEYNNPDDWSSPFYQYNVMFYDISKNKTIQLADAGNLQNCELASPIIWDGLDEHIAFISRSSKDIKNTMITILNLQTKKKWDLDGGAELPNISLDGRQVVYLRNGILCVGDIQTQTTKEITNGKRFVLNPTWSPDGKFISFLEYNKKSVSGKEAPYLLKIIKVDNQEEITIESGMYLRAENIKWVQ